MNIGIIGAGAIGQAWATQFVCNSHNVILSNSRGPASLADAVRELGPKARAAAVREAAAADLVLVSVPWKHLPAALADLPPWGGRIVIDTNNPIVTPGFTVAGLGGRTSSEVFAGLVPGARVVKAGNTLQPHAIAADPRVAGGRRVQFVSGDDADAKAVVAKLRSGASTCACAASRRRCRREGRGRKAPRTNRVRRHRPGLARRGRPPRAVSDRPAARARPRAARLRWSLAGKQTAGPILPACGVARRALHLSRQIARCVERPAKPLAHGGAHSSKDRRRPVETEPKRCNAVASLGFSCPTFDYRRTPAPWPRHQHTSRIPAMRSTRISRHVNAPRNAVYQALLDAPSVATWRVPDGMRSHIHDFEPHEGGVFRITLTYESPPGAGKSTPQSDTFHGLFVRLVPDQRVVELIEFETLDPDLRGEMTVSISLSDSQNGGTNLIAVHDELPPGLSPADNEAGWRMSLAKLAALVEREAQPA